MTTGEGGFVTTNDDRLADWIRLYRNQGMRERYHHEILGYNFRMTDIAAAIGLVQLDKLERNTARRQAIARRYDEAFADLPVQLPVIARGPDPRLPPVHDRRRARPATQIVADMQRGRRRRAASTTRSRSTARPTSWSAASTPTCRSPTPRPPTACRLPMYPGLTDAEQAQVIEAVRAAVASPRRPRPAPRDDGRLDAGRRPRLRVGLAGLGSMGRNHLRVISNHPDDGRSSPIADPVAGRPRRPPSAQTGAPGFADPLAMIAEAELDARRHRRADDGPRRRSPSPRSSAASPVLVEKPLAATVEDGLRDRGRRRRERGVRVQVGHVERFNPAVLEMGRLLARGLAVDDLRHHEPPGRARSRPASATSA